ncbi:GntR family transcriptional regulator [Rhodovulum sulfidophilum]|uniref:GntR family transcriptional regulator n=1 Tax=Rhodovulum sulfidophilum TaxID=35806 RepID=UPI001E361D28|nr:GntR family transcriptional regulator [Rhodovulum sulfidophilum]
MATPLYQTVIDTIVARIASGELPSGALLPSETQLGAELGVSQGTARKALSELEKRGLVQRAQPRHQHV